MSELALRLIRENIEKHRRGEDARMLDLGNCGMTEVHRLTETRYFCPKHDT